MSDLAGPRLRLNLAGAVTVLMALPTAPHIRCKAPLCELVQGGFMPTSLLYRMPV